MHVILSIIFLFFSKQFKLLQFRVLSTFAGFVRRNNRTRASFTSNTTNYISIKKLNKNERLTTFTLTNSQEPINRQTIGRLFNWIYRVSNAVIKAKKLRSIIYKRSINTEMSGVFDILSYSDLSEIFASKVRRVDICFWHWMLCPNFTKLAPIKDFKILCFAYDR